MAFLGVAHPRSLTAGRSPGKQGECFFIVSAASVFYVRLVTPRVPWTPIDVMQILLAWILAIFIGQLAYGLLVPPKIEGAHEVIDGNQSLVVLFLPNYKFESKTNSGTFQFQGNPPAQDRTTLILKPEDSPEMVVQFGGTVRDRVGMVMVNMFFIQGGAILLVLLLLRKHKLDWTTAFGGLGPPAQTIALPILLGSAIILPAMILHLVSFDLISRLGGAPSVQHAVQMVSRAQNPGEIAVQIISVIIFAPIAEELLFRGTLYPAIKNAGHPRLATIASAVLFAAVHAKLELMLPLTLLGIALVWLYEKTGSILAPILMHTTFNLINFSMIKFISPETLKPLQDTLKRIVIFWN